MTGKAGRVSNRSEPSSLWLIRHGESAGNVARERAYEQRAAVIDVADRDMDVPLSELGRTQAVAFGRWLRTVPQAELPTVVLSSPYVRAGETARIALSECGGPVAQLRVVLDERLRDRDFGILDRLTGRGIAERHPEQAELRSRFGKFYHRPPGGEAWTDVLLRLRSVYGTLELQHPGENVAIFAHDIVVTCFRYLLEGLTEAQVLELSNTVEIANCSVTSYRFGGPAPELTRFNVVAPLEEQGAPVTSEPDAAAAHL
jgi:probable phosphoglycerate mutase